MKVYFSHGKESGPWGSKITRLAAVAESYGLDVESIDYTTIDDPDVRVERLLQALENEVDRFILVGSSMGGYASLVASMKVKAEAVFLLAPALYMQGYGVQQYHSLCSNIEIVHGWLDDVIPFENSVKFAQASDSTLHMISGDHRLNGSLKSVEKIFDLQLKGLISNMT